MTVKVVASSAVASPPTRELVPPVDGGRYPVGPAWPVGVRDAEPTAFADRILLSAAAAGAQRKWRQASVAVAGSALMGIDGSLIGSADPSATAVTGVAQEAKDRLVVEAATTDLKSPVDVYLPDIDPKTGEVRNRWVTPQVMTGENIDGMGGGITTRNAGPQPQRARLRANKSPAGLLSDPTRTLRVADRVTCVPSSPSGHAFDGTSSTAAQTAVDDCLKNVPLNANGLQAGICTAPMFGFVFPENTRLGDSLVPNDLWHLGFLRFGEGANPITPAVGGLQPPPW